MIQATDLRLGNWVYWTSHCIEPIQIAIDHLKDIIEGAPYFSPILLSAELLEKCGFVLVEDLGDQKYFQLPNKPYGYGVNLDHDELAFISYKGGYVYTLINDEIHFQHLHQLQNLFHALTGEELLIDLK
jgi:hypothetical protein